MAVALTLGVLFGVAWLTTMAKRAKTGARVAAADRIPQKLVITTALAAPLATAAVKRCAHSVGLRDAGTFNDTTFLDNGKGLRMDCVTRSAEGETEIVLVQSSVRRVNGRPVKTGPMRVFFAAVQAQMVSADPLARVRRFDS